MKSRTSIGITPTQRLAMSGALQSVLRVLRMDAEALAAFLEEQAAEIPALTLRPAVVPLGDWLPRWSGLGLGDTGQAAEMPQAEPSLYAHVTAALPGLVPQLADQQIALALTEALEPTGWLGRDLAGVAAELAVPVSRVAAVLQQMQKIEPAGLFARDLAECLRLQAADAGVLDGVMAVLLDNLALVAKADWPRLAGLAGCSVAEIQQRFAVLRGFNPKPGTAFSAVASPLREPDLLARKTPVGWSVELNRSSLPTLAIEETDASAPRARDVLRLIQTRNATLLLVGRAILAHQSRALDQGPTALRPLTMQALAEELSLHKSTVSRVVAGTAVDTPLGSWWLRSLFSADMGGDQASAALRARLARLVAAEDKARPLSDQALAQALSGEGAAIARRTVAKYRAALNIAPAHGRRRPSG